MDSFVREALAVGSQVYSPTDENQATGLVIGLMRRAGGNEYLGWSEDELLLPHLGEAIGQAGFARLNPGLPQGEAPELRRVRLAALGQARVGVTGTLAGLADTGTLVLSSGPERPRLASLLAPVHIALLSTYSLYPTMADFFSEHPAAVRESSNLVFITGPSRSADIELTLTIGVHGPCELHILLLS